MHKELLIFQEKMAFKYTCVLLLVSLVFLLAQAKRIKKGKKGNTKQKGFYTENVYIIKCVQFGLTVV